MFWSWCFAKLVMILLLTWREVGSVSIKANISRSLPLASVIVASLQAASLPAMGEMALVVLPDDLYSQLN